MTVASSPRRRGVPAYRLHRASGQAVVTLSGTDLYLGPHGSDVSRREYDRLVSEWLANNRRLPIAPEARPVLSVSQLILAYWRFIEGYYVKYGRATSEQHVIRSALRPVRRLYGCTAAANFGPVALKVVREQHLAAGLARRTINRYVDHAKRMFKWAVENELVTGLRIELEAYLFSPTEAEQERNAHRRRQRKSAMTPSHAGRRPSCNRKRPPTNRYTAASYRRAIHRACDQASVPHLRFHE